jgi:hypothetical protein
MESSIRRPQYTTAPGILCQRDKEDSFTALQSFGSGDCRNYVVWCVDTTPVEISAAFRIEDESRIGFWAALMIAAARKAGADRILSEDLNAGQVIAGMRVENPFSKPI